VVDIKVLYWNLWGDFDDNCEPILRLVFSWPRLERGVSLIQVTAFVARSTLLVFNKLMSPEYL